MAYIYGLLVVLLFFGVMHFFTELTLRQKAITTVLLLLFVTAALYYNTLQESKEVHVRDVMLRFNQEKSLSCGTLEVNSTNYTLSVGTQTFIGKRKSAYAGKMVMASECE